MKIKDFILASVVALNVVLCVLALGLWVARSPADRTPTDMSGILTNTAYAGSATDAAGYFRVCTVQVSSSRAGVAVIDTGSNRLNFYLSEPGRKEFRKVGDTIDLARAFQHPKR
ncbi:MAG: hypothetical protein GWP05_08345 [Anaerolineaceae bacterium]|nr:hypothetical protein [Anaerolineaceae bacterium]